MHEMAVARSILDLAIEEMHRHQSGNIEHIVVEYGALTGVMPDALDFCFQAMTAGTPHEGISLELKFLPLRLKCGICGAEFGGEGSTALWNPCPVCGEELGHEVLQGRELILKQVTVGLHKPGMD